VCTSLCNRYFTLKAESPAADIGVRKGVFRGLKSRTTEVEDTEGSLSLLQYYQ
jgi:hypothetical protein